VGFINELVPDGAALAAGIEVATQIADNAPRAVRASKRVVQYSLLADLDGAFALEEAVGREILAGAEAAEGAQAFAAKRAPNWRRR
jgi:enoyl-CoA hydratase